MQTFFYVVVVVVIIGLLHIIAQGSAYRLGDFVRHKCEYRFYNMRVIACICFPNTILSAYGPDRAATDLKKLIALTTCTFKSKRKFAAIHIRVGDVIDNNTLSVADIWNIDNNPKIVPGSYNNVKGICLLHSFLGVRRHLTGYTKSKTYYVSIAEKLRNMGITKLLRWSDATQAQVITIYFTSLQTFREF